MFTMDIKMFHTPTYDLPKCFIPPSGKVGNVSYPAQKHSGRVCRLKNEPPLKWFLITVRSTGTASMSLKIH